MSHAPDFAYYARPQELAALRDGRRRLNLCRSGAGAPTIVMNAGLGNTALTWLFVQPALAAVAQVCAFDRAGLGFSDESAAPADSEHAVGDLRDALQAAAVSPPYILVGHSLGAIHMMVFANLHRDEVAGLVLVDPGISDACLATASASGFAKFESLTAQQLFCLRAFASGEMHPGAPAWAPCGETVSMFAGMPSPVREAYEVRTRAIAAATLSEREHLTASYALLASSRGHYGDLPMIVLSAGGNIVEGQGGLTAEEAGALQAERDTVFAEYAALSDRGVVRHIPGADHAIQLSHPAAVIEAVQEVVSLARA